MERVRSVKVRQVSEAETQWSVKKWKRMKTTGRRRRRSLCQTQGQAPGSGPRAQESDITPVWCGPTAGALMSVWEGFKLRGLAQIRLGFSASGKKKKNGTGLWASIMAHAGKDALRLTQMSAGPETLSSHVVYYLTRRESLSLSGRWAVVCCVGWTLNQLHDIYLYFKVLLLISILHFYGTVLRRGRDSTLWRTTLIWHP